MSQTIVGDLRSTDDLMIFRNCLRAFMCFWFVQKGLALDDGIYLLRDGPPESSLRLQGGTPGRIERKLKQTEYNLSVVSQSNWNDRFQVRLDYKISPVATNVKHLAIALDGKLYSVIGALSDSLQCLTTKPVSQRVDKPLAVRIAAITGETPALRKHIGQKIGLRFITGRGFYRKDEPIGVLVQVTNFGNTPITIGIENQVNKSRSSQLQIVPFGESEPRCTDVRSRTTIASSLDKDTIGPGESRMIREEVLQRWYETGTSGNYYFTGMYKLRIYKRENDIYPCWIEHLASDFEFEYAE